MNHQKLEAIEAYKRYLIKEGHAQSVAMRIAERMIKLAKEKEKSK